ncbi:glutathione S-transferase family protein [Wenxinia marina]|uniref:Glutathione S-transferase n=1 Tax=Wenxinia marina DSM 24838 TaxID=1123501 RepID=A0A0D0Q7D6_9RHOB|nr:glutathione binding-like protein [Wenxinia marina]KIQ70349.1 Glutathione S-transferase [Wenxinia marina DSM 24838]GGL53839.1 glutathione S-transferase [Wenxinia marina]
MLTFYHAPRSRSTRIRNLMIELGIVDEVTTRLVQIRRNDGSGGADPANPHLDGKVPLLDHDGVQIWESTAIMLYLTDLFPEAGLGVPQGDRLRGRYLSWLAWYGDVLEPVLVHAMTGLSHPALDATFRGKAEALARLEWGLSDGPWLMGDRYTAADIVCASAFTWGPDMMPDSPVLRGWIERCTARPGYVRAAQMDEADVARA